MGSGFVFKAMPHVLPKENWGEQQCSVFSWKVKKMGPVDRHKLVESWSSCRYTDTHRAASWGQCLHSHLRNEGRMEINGYSYISVSTSVCNKGKRLVNCLAKSSHSFCGTNWATEQTLLHTLNGFALGSQFVHSGQMAGLGLFFNWVLESKKARCNK